MNKSYNVENKKSHKKCRIFLDDENDGVTIARYDEVKYDRVLKMYEKQMSFFWRPEEVDVTRDAKDFKELSEHEKHIFLSNLKRQILLDSVQGRSPNLAFLPITTLPEVETFIEAWSFVEGIHNKSYTHLIRNVLSDPSEVFDEINNIEEIVDCAKDISMYYDNLIEFNNYTAINGYDEKYTKYLHKKALWMALMSVNILEGIRFYISFACSWAFAENNKMEGNAKIIKFIARDENLHLGFTQFLLNTLLKDDPDYEKIKEETNKESIKLFQDAVNQEKEWAEYLFKDGSMIGLNAELLKQYIEWIANKRMRAVNLESPYKVSQANPLPWTQSWIAGKERQVAPQETEISSYVVGEVDKSMESDAFKGFDL